MKRINWAKNIMLITFVLIIFRGLYFGYQPHIISGLEAFVNLAIELGYISAIILYVSPIFEYIEYKIAEWEASQKGLNESRGTYRPNKDEQGNPPKGD
jgi:hypothetical protein